MEITVNIKCPDLPLAAAALAKAITGITVPAMLTPKAEIDPEAVKAAMQAAPVYTMTPQPTVAPAAPVQAPVTPVAPTPTPAPAAVPTQTTVAPPAPTGAVTAPAPAVPVTAAPQITGDMVAKAGADLIAANPAAMAQLNALLQKYGVGCAQELWPDQIGSFATEMRALGAKI